MRRTLSLFTLLVLGGLGSLPAQAQSKSEEECPKVLEPALQVLNPIAEIGQCFNQPPPVKFGFLSYMYAYKQICDCLETDPRDGEEFRRVVKETKRGHLRVDAFSAAPDGKTDRSLNGSEERSKDEAVAPVLQRLGSNVIPPGQCFSMEDFQRHKQFPRPAVLRFLAINQQYVDDDWSYENQAKQFHELNLQIKKKQDSKVPFDDEILRANGLRARMQFLYQNPQIRALFSSGEKRRSDDGRFTSSKKSDLFGLLKAHFNNKTGMCIISTLPDCPFGKIDRDSQLAFEKRLQTFFSDPEVRQLVAEGERTIAKRTRALKRRRNWSEANFLKHALEKTSVNLKTDCIEYQRATAPTPQSVSQCVAAYASQCKMIEKIKEETSEDDIDNSILEEQWDEEGNLDPAANKDYRAAAQQLCHEKIRYSRTGGGEKTFAEFVSSERACERTPPSENCNDTHKLYSKYQALYSGIPPAQVEMVEVEPAQMGTTVIGRPTEQLPLVKTDFRALVQQTKTPTREELSPTPQPQKLTDKSASTPTETSTPQESKSKPELSSSKPTPPVPQNTVPGAQAAALTQLPTPNQPPSVIQQVAPTPTLATPNLETPKLEPTPVVAKTEVSSDDRKTDLESELPDTKSKRGRRVETQQKPNRAGFEQDQEIADLREEIRALNARLEGSKKAEQVSPKPTPTLVKSSETPVTQVANVAPTPMVDAGAVSPSLVSQNLNPKAPVGRAAVSTDQKVEALSGLNKRMNTDVREYVGSGQGEKTFIALRALSPSQMKEASPELGDIESRPQFVINVEDSEDFNRLVANDAATVAKYKEKLKSSSNYTSNGVLILTNSSGESVYFSLVTEKSGTFAQQIILDEKQKKVLRTAELSWLKKILAEQTQR